MRILKSWYMYRRNGYFYVQFKDKITGKKLTAKSTGETDYNRAMEIVHRWYYDPDSFFNTKQKKNNAALLKDFLKNADFNDAELMSIFNDRVLSAVHKMTGLVPNSGQENAAGFYQVQMPLNDEEQYPPEIKKIIKDIDKISFIDYLLLFWDYKTSPYIEQLLRLGKKPPNQERFINNTYSLKKYVQILGGVLLKNIKADDINTMLGKIKQAGNLRESTLSKIRYIIVQAMRFGYDNKFLQRDITRNIRALSNKNRKKEIFTKDELKRLFSLKENVFCDKSFLLVNKLLLTTGCRIGELQALKISDVIKADEGYLLRINKNYSRLIQRIKETKTAREDDVPISNEMAQELLAFIETNPFKNNRDAFLFYSAKKEVPLSYCHIKQNFNKTLVRLGIKRENLTLHSYRHTFTSLLQDAGFSDIDLLYLTRHEDIKQVQRYGNHMTPAKELKKRKAADIIYRVIPA